MKNVEIIFLSSRAKFWIRSSTSPNQITKSIVVNKFLIQLVSCKLALKLVQLPSIAATFSLPLLFMSLFRLQWLCNGCNDWTVSIGQIISKIRTEWSHRWAEEEVCRKWAAFITIRIENGLQSHKNPKTNGCPSATDIGIVLEWLYGSKRRRSCEKYLAWIAFGRWIPHRAL